MRLSPINLSLIRPTLKTLMTLISVSMPSLSLGRRLSPPRLRLVAPGVFRVGVSRKKMLWNI